MRGEGQRQRKITASRNPHGLNPRQVHGQSSRRAKADLTSSVKVLTIFRQKLDELDDNVGQGFVSVLEDTQKCAHSPDAFTMYSRW